MQLGLTVVAVGAVVGLVVLVLLWVIMGVLTQ